MTVLARFCGRREVQRRRKCTQRTGKVTTAVLTVRGGSNVSYRYCYVHPLPEVTGIGAAGHPIRDAHATLYREGESSAPVVDDKLTVGGNVYQIVGVTAENNADESSGYAVYQLSMV